MALGPMIVVTRRGQTVTVMTHLFICDVILLPGSTGLSGDKGSKGIKGVKGLPGAQVNFREVSSL